MSQTAQRHSHSPGTPRRFRPPGHAPSAGRPSYTPAGRNRSAPEAPPPGTPPAPAAGSRRSPTEGRWRSTRQVTNRPTRGFVPVIDAPPLPIAIAGGGPPSTPLPEADRWSVLHLPRCERPSWRASTRLQDHPLRAATSRQVGSCCDRSRSNVHRSVISVTASVPVKWPAILVVSVADLVGHDPRGHQSDRGLSTPPSRR